MKKYFFKAVLAVTLFTSIFSCKEDNKKPKEPERHWAKLNSKGEVSQILEAHNNIICDFFVVYR